MDPWRALRSGNTASHEEATHTVCYLTCLRPEPQISNSRSWAIQKINQNDTRRHSDGFSLLLVGKVLGIASLLHLHGGNLPTQHEQARVNSKQKTISRLTNQRSHRHRLTLKWTRHPRTASSPRYRPGRAAPAGGGCQPAPTAQPALAAAAGFPAQPRCPATPLWCHDNSA